MKKILGQKAVGEAKDRTFRGSFNGKFSRGYRIYGTIKEYNPSTQKYLIEGQKFYFNEAGEEFVLTNYNLTMGWFNHRQIKIIN